MLMRLFLNTYPLSAAGAGARILAFCDRRGVGAGVLEGVGVGDREGRGVRDGVALGAATVLGAKSLPSLLR